MSLDKMHSHVMNSLSFLDNANVCAAIVFILFLYNLCVFKNINSMVSNVYQYTIIRIIVLLLIIYVSQKNCLIGILLAVSYVLSMTYNSMEEYFAMGDIKPFPSPSESEKVSMESNMEPSMDPAMEPTMEPDQYSMSEPYSNKKKSESPNMDNNLSENNCMNNYYPAHEKVGNLCDPVATYQGEYNAQGLNYPIGHDKDQGGYSI